jgi:hypothetical protein
MTLATQLPLGLLCGAVPSLACLTACCTDYSDTLNFSLTVLLVNRRGKPLQIRSSVHASLVHIRHQFAANGNPCVSVRLFTRRLSLYISHITKSQGVIND